MLLVLSEEHKEHLGFLSEVDPAVVGEFGRIAVEFLKKVQSQSQCTSAPAVFREQEEIRQILSLPHYHNLEVMLRSDKQTLTVCVSAGGQPTVTLKLHLEDGARRSACVLQTDPATQRALKSSRRILHNIR
uniref:COMM domain-containing protein n=1 Tax=Sinocyclocheilus rhinocerous TaxID=307959 RepID=A0A673L299_9TELE